ncbi:MAG TPA: hypothetical protein VII30_00625 [Gemmatimonadaceae bacterium]
MPSPPIVIPRWERSERLSFPLSATQQKILGYFLLLHGVAHAAVGIWAAETGHWWMVASLWELAMVGFIAAAFGALGVSGLRDAWRGITIVAASASMLLFLTSPHRAFLLGLGIDIMALALVAYSRSAAPEIDKPVGLARRIGRLSGVVIAWLVLIYVALVLAIRPWNIQWGTTAAERAMALPGDQLVPVAHYRIDHGITINAPTTAVWPWLIQIGQDRGGFYSYSALENAVGAEVTNVEGIVPEWQSRRVGELVRSVPPNWMGGRFGFDIGWKVLELIPGQAIVLEGWGSFTLFSINDSTTRMLIRTRGSGLPSVGSLVLSPLGLLVFEPAHLIMERRMLLGIKERAERSVDKTFFVQK